MNKTRDLAAYRVAFGFTFVYAALIVAAWASGSEALQYPRQMLSLAVLSGLVVNIGFPAVVTAAKNQLSRTVILKRAGPLVVAAAVMSWAVLYYSVTYLFQNGLPGWAAWLVGIVLSGIVTMLVSFFVIGAPKKNALAQAGDYIGALKEGETWKDGYRILPAPKNQTVHPGQLEVGGIPLDWGDEVKHTLICGMTGAGKSQVCDGFLRALRLRANSRCIIVDNNGDYYRKHGRPGDRLVNPFDAQSASWSSFAEIKGPADYLRLSAAFIPMLEGANKEWFEFGRDLMADTKRAMNERGNKNPRKLYDLLTGPQEELTAYLSEAGLTGWTSPQMQKMLGSIRGTIKPYIRIFEHLKPDGDFSVRDWVQNGDGGEGWLFITYRESDKELMKQFVAALADIAIVEGLNLPSCEGLPKEQHRRLFYFLDELDSIGNIPKLLDGFTKFRKYGCALVVGIQTLAQLRLVYGKDTAESILGNVSTRVIMKQGDGDTAEEMQKKLGKQVIERRLFTSAQTTGNSRPGWFSTGQAHSSTGQTLNEQKQVVPDHPIVTIKDLTDMPALSGILARPEGPRHPFKLAYINMPGINERFVEIKE